VDGKDERKKVINPDSLRYTLANILFKYFVIFFHFVKTSIKDEKFKYTIFDVII